MEIWLSVCVMSCGDPLQFLALGGARVLVHVHGVVMSALAEESATDNFIYECSGSGVCTMGAVSGLEFYCQTGYFKTSHLMC